VNHSFAADERGLVRPYDQTDARRSSGALRIRVTHSLELRTGWTIMQASSESSRARNRRTRITARHRRSTTARNDPNCSGSRSGRCAPEDARGVRGSAVGGHTPTTAGQDASQARR